MRTVKGTEEVLSIVLLSGSVASRMATEIRPHKANVNGLNVVTAADLQGAIRFIVINNSVGAFVQFEFGIKALGKYQYFVSGLIFVLNASLIFSDIVALSCLLMSQPNHSFKVSGNVGAQDHILREN